MIKYETIIMFTIYIFKKFVDKVALKNKIKNIYSNEQYLNKMTAIL